MANKKNVKTDKEKVTEKKNKQESKKTKALEVEDLEKELVSNKSKYASKEKVEEYDDEEYEDDNYAEEKVEKPKSVKKNETHEKKPIKVPSCEVISILTLLVSIVVLIISICILVKVNKIETNGVKENEKDETNDVVPSDETETIDYDVSMFKGTSGDEFLDILEKDDDKIYVVNVGKKNCQFSQRFLPSLQQSVKEYDYTLYYVSLDDTTVVSKATDIIQKSDVFTQQNTAFGITPCTYIIKNGEVIDQLVGYNDYSELQKLLEKYDIEKK